MFRRRSQQSPISRIREVLWPRAGWRRWATYLAHRVKRLPGTPHRIAAGLAAGAAVSCAPLPGVHFLLALLLAVATRGSPLASAIGTAFGNPWTFPFLWGAAHSIGVAMTPGADAGQTLGAGDIAELLVILPKALLTLDMSVLSERIMPVWQPMMVGSVPLGLTVWVVVYLSARRAVAGYRARRNARLKERADSYAAENYQVAD